jgi:hypothetical protein
VSEGRRAQVASIRAVERLTVDDIVREAERAAKLTIPASRCSTPTRACATSTQRVQRG